MSRGLDHSEKCFFMWFFMWFCKTNVEIMVIFEFTGCFYWLPTFLGHTKAFWSLKPQETLVYNYCTICGKLFKTTIFQNSKRNHTKCQFSIKNSDPLHLTFVHFFWVEWLLIGERTAYLVFSWKVGFVKHFSTHFCFTMSDQVSSKSNLCGKSFISPYWQIY